MKWNTKEQTNARQTDRPTGRTKDEEPTKRQFPDLLDQSSKMVDAVIPILKFNRGLLDKF